MTGTKPSREFTALEGFAFCLAFIGIQICSETFNQWGIYFYSPSEGGGRTIYVPIALVGAIFIIATLWDAITDPLIGAWSDHTRTRPGLARLLPIRGRRRPFIFWGSLLMSFSFIATWYPPVEGTSTINFWYGTFMLCLHWTFFTITTVPLLALGPEVARSEAERVRLGIWIAVGMVVGLAIANALSGELVVLLDDSAVPGVTSPTGYRRLAMVYAVIALALFQFLVWAVKERFDSEAVPHPHEPLLKALLSVLGNRPFVLYFIAFFMFSAGFLAVQRVIPYWAELGLGGNESTVTLLLAPYLFTCLATYAFMPALTRRFHVKWMMFTSLAIITTGLPTMYFIGAADATTTTKTLLGGLLFAYTGIGQGIYYVMVTPMLGEIIDYDAERTGHRREALYNGLSGVAWKASMGVSILIATQSMHHWGNSIAQPQGVYLVGPLAGLCGLAGCIALWFYPVLNPKK